MSKGGGNDLYSATHEWWVGSRKRAAAIATALFHINAACADLRSLFLLHHAPFLKERDAVAQDVIVVVFVFLRVHALIDLLQGGVTRTLELVEGLRVFRFEDRDAGVDAVVHDHVTAALAVLFIRVDHIAGAGENAGEERMVEILAVKRLYFPYTLSSIYIQIISKLTDEYTGIFVDVCYNTCKERS